MSSYKLSMAHIRGVESADELADVLRSLGAGTDQDEFGVLSADTAADVVHAKLIRRTTETVDKFDAEINEIVSEPVTSVKLLTFAIWPAAERLEVYSGGAAQVRAVGEFLLSLGMPVVVRPVEVDVVTAVELLLTKTRKAQLRSATATDYAASSYMIGTYGPKFMDTEHGRQFIEQYAAALKTAVVRFSGPSARATATIRPDGCFSYTCHEDDQADVQQILRRLVWKPRPNA